MDTDCGDAFVDSTVRHTSDDMRRIELNNASPSARHVLGDINGTIMERRRKGGTVNYHYPGGLNRVVSVQLQTPPRKTKNDSSHEVGAHAVTPTSSSVSLQYAQERAQHFYEKFMAEAKVAQEKTQAVIALNSRLNESKRVILMLKEKLGYREKKETIVREANEALQDRRDRSHQIAEEAMQIVDAVMSEADLKPSSNDVYRRLCQTVLSHSFQESQKLQSLLEEVAVAREEKQAMERALEEMKVKVNNAGHQTEQRLAEAEHRERGHLRYIAELELQIMKTMQRQGYSESRERSNSVESRESH